ncbi:ATP-dependent 23S rRNA helicase DbpA [plant metagenome]|uniref:ATP-dependent 23S rRNA helicase DbpA n=1 Tax=plant metagenome TaxID=1297885 RepID=A0A484TWR0_9ZZZZ
MTDPVTQTAFSALPLNPALLSNLETLGYAEMTPIQAEALPVILSGQDLIAQAKTGSGKTATFGLALLHALNPHLFAVQALVLCPTRELADQVALELRKLARAIPNIKILTLCGGTPIRPQTESLAHGAHVVVGTPGRLMDHLARGNLALERLRTLVLDEADRMLDMGFFDDIAQIVAQCPARRQTLLFSATYAADIRRASARFLNRPAEVKVEALHAPTQITQIFYEIPRETREAAVETLIRHFRPVSTLAFCNTRAQCENQAAFLRERGISAMALHGDLEQRDRDAVLLQFANQSCSVLVATDVAARGLDISSLDAVINVDVTQDTEVHVHRVGRTGRAGEKGLALNLCAPHEMRWATLVEKYLGTPLRWDDITKLSPAPGGPLLPPMVTLSILGGKKQKLRPGDLMGALAGEAGLTKEQVGKITVQEFYSYVAIARDVAPRALAALTNGNIKGRHFRVRVMDGTTRDDEAEAAPPAERTRPGGPSRSAPGRDTAPSQRAGAGNRTATSSQPRRGAGDGRAPSRPGAPRTGGPGRRSR